MTEHNNDERSRYEQIGDRVSIFLRGRIWQANWVDQDGNQRRQSLKTHSLKEARRRAQKLEAELEQGVSSPRMRVASVAEAVEAYESYLSAEGRAKKTLAKYRKVFARTKALAVTRGVADLRGINLTFADAYRKMRVEEGAQPKTIHVEMTVLKQLANFSVRRELIPINKMAGLKLKRPKPTRQPCWSLPQVHQILNAAAGSAYHSLFSLLALSGMRIGEAKHLAWDDVDIDRRVLNVRTKWIGPEKGDHWKPKSGDERAIPLCESAIELLRSLPRRGRWVFSAPSSRARVERDRRIDERRALYHLKQVLKSVDLEGHLHTFRHSLITHALLSGTPEAVVRKWAGHLDPSVLKLYTHVLDEDSKAHMDRLFPGAEGTGEKTEKKENPSCEDDSERRSPAGGTESKDPEEASDN
jgi:site-specific recombinase XerD